CHPDVRVRLRLAGDQQGQCGESKTAERSSHAANRGRPQRRGATIAPTGAEWRHILVSRRAGAMQLFQDRRVSYPEQCSPEALMANSSFETFKQGGQAIDEAAQKTGQQTEGVYEQAKGAASGAYETASEYAGDAVSRVQDRAADLADMVSEQVSRHPKALVA